MTGTEQAEFLSYYVRHQGEVFAYVATMLSRRQDIEEVFSEVSLILWKKWPEYDRQRPFLPWARAIAFNEIRNYLRRSRRKNVTFSEELLTELMQTREWADEALAARSQALNECLKGLSGDEQSVLHRCYHQSQPIKQVAQSMGMQPSALYMRLHRIRQFLHECIDYRLMESAT